MGQAAPKTIPKTMDALGVRANRGTREEAIALITHRFPLRDFRRAYAVFAQRVDGALKVLVTPWQR